MARPIKNYCDYFTHDRDMRNHRKVKALRNKFGVTGYAIWSMLLEYLTGADGNEFENSEHELELISGDFGIPVEDISDVLNYCIKLEMLFDKEGFIHSESLDERLSVVYEKRKVAKDFSKKQYRKNGKFITNKTEPSGVLMETMPQSKVKKSKVKKTIKKNEFNTMPLHEDFTDLPELSRGSAYELVFRTTGVKLDDETINSMWNVFKIERLTGHNFYANESKVYSHFTDWIKKKDFKQPVKNTYQSEIEEKLREFKPIIE